MPAPAPRPVYVYTVPPGIADGYTSLGFVEIDSEEEIQAIKRASGVSQRFAIEAAKTSLAEVNGDKVSLADGSADIAWAKFPPKVRVFALSAYADLHQPPDEVTSAFLTSRAVKV
jgi:hypothetical protein